MTHPVLAELMRSPRAAGQLVREQGLITRRGRTVEQVVIEHGRPFIGIDRPKSYRPRARKYCFKNAGVLAFDDRGRYVEGFAISSRGTCCHHAWITLNGVDAIDVTWPDAPGCHYFGIEFPTRVLSTWATKRRYWGLLDPLDDDLLADAGLLGPPYDLAGVVR